MQGQNLRALQRFHFFPAVLCGGAQVSDRSAKKPRWARLSSLSDDGDG
jgi:hypothetical protein